MPERGRTARRPFRGLRLRHCEELDAAGRIAGPRRHDPPDCAEKRRIESDLPLAQLESPIRLGTRELELPAVERHPGGRDVVLVLLEPVLERNVPCALRELGGDAPVPLHSSTQARFHIKLDVDNSSTSCQRAIAVLKATRAWSSGPARPII